MGLSGISPGSLLLIFMIILLLTGGKRLRNIGEDLGAAFRSFRKGLNDPENHNDNNQNIDYLENKNNPDNKPQ